MGSRSSKTQKIYQKPSSKTSPRGEQSEPSFIFEILSKPEHSSKIMQHLRIHPNPLNVIYEAPQDMETSVLIERLTQ